MRLLNDFFTILETTTDGNNFRCATALNAKHKIFEVHFPGNPVVPGACLLEMASEILEQQTGMALNLKSVKEIRFKRAISPACKPLFCFRKTTAEGALLHTNITVEDEEGTAYATMQLCYNKEQ